MSIYKYIQEQEKTLKQSRSAKIINFPILEAKQLTAALYPTPKKANWKGVIIKENRSLLPKVLKSPYSRKNYKHDLLNFSPEKETLYRKKNNSDLPSFRNTPITQDFLQVKSVQRIKLDIKEKTKKSEKTKYLFASRTRKGTKEVNQDSLLFLESIFGLPNYSIFSVFDGHGQNGHYISRLVKKIFINYFSSRSEMYYFPRHPKELTSKEPINLKEYIHEEDIYLKLKSDNFKIIKSAFKEAEIAINASDYEKAFSGSTACTVFLMDNYLICANVGDSRAILITKKNEIYQLSNDHKPELLKEKERILRKGGEVKQRTFGNLIKGLKVPFRVFGKDKTYPGLAMSRSLGDLVAKQYGVISDAEIFEYQLNEDTKYICIASDGVWEHLNNEEVMLIIEEFYLRKDPDGAINKLIAEATKRFLRIGEYIDDISIILIFLNILKNH